MEKMEKMAKKCQKKAKKMAKKAKKGRKKAAKRGKKKICDSPPLFWGKKFDFSVVFPPPFRIRLFQKIKNRLRVGPKNRCCGQTNQFGEFRFRANNREQIAF